MFQASQNIFIFIIRIFFFFLIITKRFERKEFCCFFCYQKTRTRSDTQIEKKIFRCYLILSLNNKRGPRSSVVCSGTYASLFCSYDSRVPGDPKAFSPAYAEISSTLRSELAERETTGKSVSLSFCILFFFFLPSRFNPRTDGEFRVDSSLKLFCQATTRWKNKGRFPPGSVGHS